MTTETKRRKVKKSEDETKSNHIRCGYFILKKQRHCAMQRKADQQYCSEHMIYAGTSQQNGDSADKRIPCPLDGNHTLWEKDLKSHLKRCNAKPKKEHDMWYDEDLNLKTNKHKEVIDLSGKSEDDGLDEKALFDKYFPLLDKLNFEPLKTQISQHSGLNSRISELKRPKHALQQSSLIGHMRDRGLLQPENYYLEFGCGKAELSRFVNICVIEDLKSNNKTSEGKNYGFGLIDRGLNRMKMDPKIRKDATNSPIEAVPNVRRTRIDIKDLSLDKFVETTTGDKFVGISKHLCGVATDLTLSSILNSELLGAKFGGLLIAMCCRHVCSYDQLLPLSKVYLQKKGFGTRESFAVLKKMVSWAVCGTGRSGQDSKDEDNESENENEENGAEDKESDDKNDTEDGDSKSDPLDLGLTFEEREAYGLIARRLVDESRVYALREYLEGYDVEIFHYTERDVTLENVCLCIKPSTK